VSLELELQALPLLPGALELAPGFEPGGLKANRREYAAELDDRAAPDAARRALIYDPQTSGGLLLAAPATRADALLAELPGARRIGRVREPGPRPIVLC
jgi:selenide,water dikinase